MDWCLNAIEECILNGETPPHGWARPSAHPLGPRMPSMWCTIKSFNAGPFLYNLYMFEQTAKHKGGSRGTGP